MKRKSTLSSSITAGKYEEAIGENLSQHGVQSTSAYDINTRQEAVFNEAEESNGPNGNAKVKERPRSLPPDGDGATYPVAAPRHRTQNEDAEPRPVPKPRPRTMFLKSEAADPVLKAKTVSADNLLKTIPSIERVRSGSEIGGSVPPVPLKRAQMYRSHEGINSSNGSSSKESKF